MVSRGGDGRATQKLAIATCNEWLHLPVDDQLILPLLQQPGRQVDVVCWDDPSVHWHDYDMVILRSVWDYSWRLQEFLAWLQQLEDLRVNVHNPPAVVRENANKHYLKKLYSAGLPIPATVWLPAREPYNLIQVMTEHSWAEAVIKPVVSAGALNTHRVDLPTAPQVQQTLEKEAPGVELMVQPYLAQVEQEGEWSLIYFRGELSHSVIKRPKDRDFRVQSEHGGLSYPAVAPKVAQEIADRALTVLNARDLLYARVDGILTGETFLLMEVELTEPNLFFELDLQSPQRFASAVNQMLHQL